jgi:hypothetical protein
MAGSGGPESNKKGDPSPREVKKGMNAQKGKSGLEMFQNRLHPEVVSEIRGWAKHQELSKLLKRLESMKDWEQFLDSYAEAMVVRHLITHDCEIEVEVPTKNGKSADFKVSKGSDRFFVHVKRLNFDREMQHDLNVSTRLGSLERKGFSFSYNKSLTDDEMQQFYKEASRFAQNANHGESKVIASQSGEHLGECHKTKHGQSITVYSGKAVDESDRFSKKLARAYEQFMPDAINVILLTSAWRDAASIEDLREAVGDFWCGGEHPCSNIIGWFEFDPRGDSLYFDVFFRENAKRPPYIVKLFPREEKR